MSRVFVINQYASTPKDGFGGRWLYFAKYLTLFGQNVTVLISSYHHLLSSPKKSKNYFEKEDHNGVQFVKLKTFRYVGVRSIIRVFNWFFFTLNLFIYLLFNAKKNDKVIFSSPSLIPFLAIYLLKKIKKFKVVWDIRDLWPLTFIEIGGFSPKNIFIRFHFWIEGIAYFNSDQLITNWPYAYEYYHSKFNKKKNIEWIPNGYDSSEIIENEPHGFESILDADKFKIGYCGTLGEANAIDLLISVIERINKSPYSDLYQFVIIGNGTQYKKLEMLALKSETKIFLHKAIEKKKVLSLLKDLDCCYVGFKESPLYKYGFSLTKLPEYLISKKPIVMAINSKFDPITANDCGITVSTFDPEDLENAFLKLQQMHPKALSKIGENSKKYAKNCYDYELLSRRILELISTL